MVADELRHIVFPVFQKKPHHATERIDQQLIRIRRPFLQQRFADVEDVPDVHAVDAVQLHLFRRVAQDLLNRPLHRRHLVQQCGECGIGPGLTHDSMPGRYCG